MAHKTRLGFFLIELLIGTIILVVMGLTTANLQFFDRTVLQAELNKLYATCMYAQRCAMVLNKKQIIELDVLQKSYSYSGHQAKLAPSIEFGIIHGIKGPPSSPVYTILSPITFKNQIITFEPNGIIQPGTIYLMDNKKQNMCALSCAVSQVSFLRKYRYNKKWQLI